MRFLVAFLLAMTLSACSGLPGSFFGVLPKSSQVCPQGTNSISGECR